MNRLEKITIALDNVSTARELCPFHNTYRGRHIHGPDDACMKCRKRRNGDGGRCIIEQAEHAAVLAIEEAVA